MKDSAANSPFSTALASLPQRLLETGAEKPYEVIHGLIEELRKSLDITELEATALERGLETETIDQIKRGLDRPEGLADFLQYVCDLTGSIALEQALSFASKIRRRIEELDLGVAPDQQLAVRSVFSAVSSELRLALARNMALDQMPDRLVPAIKEIFTAFLPEDWEQAPLSAQESTIANTIVNRIGGLVPDEQEAYMRFLGSLQLLPASVYELLDVNALAAAYLKNIGHFPITVVQQMNLLPPKARIAWMNEVLGDGNTDPSIPLNFEIDGNLSELAKQLATLPYNAHHLQQFARQYVLFIKQQNDSQKSEQAATILEPFMAPECEWGQRFLAYISAVMNSQK